MSKSTSNLPDNVRVAAHGGAWFLGWDLDGARFHVWLTEDQKARDNILYKNPPTGTAHRGEGYFETRKLKANAKDNAIAVAYALNEAIERDLFNAALAADAAQKAEEEAKRQESIRIQRIKEAGVELYAALRGLLACHTVRMSSDEVEKALTMAHAAIRKAEEKPEMTDAASHGKGYV